MLTADRRKLQIFENFEISRSEPPKVPVTPNLNIVQGSCQVILVLLLAHLMGTCSTIKLSKEKS